MKTILLITLLSICAVKCFAQEIYVDVESKEESFFLGSVHDDKLKVLEKGHIVWKAKKTLEQIDLLQPEQFIEAVFSNNLYFRAEGDEPFWNATIKKDTLVFLGPIIDGINEADSLHRIKIDVYSSTMDGSFSFMFQSEDKTIYGLVRAYSYHPRKHSICELCLSDEDSLFEVFINYKSYVYKGCAIITK